MRSLREFALLVGYTKGPYRYWENHPFIIVVITHGAIALLHVAQTKRNRASS